MSETIQSSPETARAETATRILDSAERLFRHYGYTKTTVADVAKDLGMSPANIYRFFASKAEIHEALAERMLAEGEAGIRQITRLPLPAAERIRLYVTQQHRMTVETMLDREKVHEMVVVALDDQWPVIDRHLDRVTAMIAGVIRDGIAAGEFPEQDVDLAARCLMASMISVCHPQIVAQCMARANHATPEELAAFAIRALGG